MKLLLSLFMLLTLVNAEDKLKTTKVSCIQQVAYPNKTLSEQKKILIEKAKQESLEELYGTLISSSTDIENGKLISDKIKSRAIGSVRISGNPSFYNGENLGEICSKINTYITKKDFVKYQPQNIKLEGFCYNNPKISTNKIRENANYKAYITAIVKFKPSMKNISTQQAESYVHGYSKSNENFDFNTGVYCFDAVVTLLPYEFELINGVKTELSHISTKTHQLKHSTNNGLSVTFYSNDDINKKTPIYKTTITKSLSLFNSSFINNTIKKDTPYYIHISGYLDSSITRYVNLKLDADVYNIQVKINGKRVLNKHETKAGVALKAGKNKLDIFVTSSNSYDVKLLQRQDNGKYTPLSLSKLYTRK